VSVASHYSCDPQESCSEVIVVKESTHAISHVLGAQSQVDISIIAD
jgi:hypothetical protein